VSKLTKAQKKKVQDLLLQRWKTVIEEDDQTDGFYQDLALALGHGDISENSTEAIEFSHRLQQAAIAWLTRLPEVA
jgi:hypothetical protein